MDEPVPKIEVDFPYQATEAGMAVIRNLLRKMGRVKKEIISTRPSGISEYSMVMIGKLLNQKRQEVGEIRVFVTVPVNEKNIKFKIEWTRHAFGFWYTRNIIMRDVVDDPSQINIGMLRAALNPVQWTADQTVNLKSMNRMFRKVKRNRVLDLALRAGLRTGS